MTHRMPVTIDPTSQKDLPPGPELERKTSDLRPEVASLAATEPHFPRSAKNRLVDEKTEQGAPTG
jgi:hypothetical protein